MAKPRSKNSDSWGLQCPAGTDGERISPSPLLDLNTQLLLCLQQYDQKIQFYEDLKEEATKSPEGLMLHSITETDPGDGNKPVSVKIQRLSAADWILKYEDKIQHYEQLKMKCFDWLCKLTLSQPPEEETVEDMVDLSRLTDQELNTLDGIVAKLAGGEGAGNLEAW